MGKKYAQLDYYGRVQIEVLLKEGKIQSYIASSLGVSQPTLSREVSRNTEGKEIYLAGRAQLRAEKRGKEQRSKAPLKSYEIWEFVTTCLEKKLTPEAISGRLKLEKGESLSAQAIYKWLHRLPKTQMACLTKHLPHFNKRRRGKSRKGGKYLSPEENRRIANRPASIEKRSEIGHWETDNVGGKKGDKTTVSVTLERASRYMVAGKLNDLKASSKTTHLSRKLNKTRVLTLTADNGRENAGYKLLEEQLNTSYYFCHPYHSWEKGSVENSIGWLRRYIPKGSSLDDLSRQKLASVVKRYNNTPKKCLDWLTPEEVFVHNLTTQDFMHFQV